MHAETVPVVLILQWETSLSCGKKYTIQLWERTPRLWDRTLRLWDRTPCSCGIGDYCNSSTMLRQNGRGSAAQCDGTYMRLDVFKLRKQQLSGNPSEADSPKKFLLTVYGMTTQGPLRILHWQPIYSRPRCSVERYCIQPPSAVRNFCDDPICGLVLWKPPYHPEHIKIMAWNRYYERTTLYWDSRYP